ncbi:hypothetical protein BH09VER1_BH09VER1_13270 [soil metagenome]
MKLVLPLTIATLISSLSLASAETDGTQMPVQNAGFEEPFMTVPAPNPAKKAQITGMLVDGWSDNSDWADISVDYSKDTDNPHGGQSSQKVDVTRVDSGAVQVTQKVEFRANHQYIFRIWMRGTPGTVVSMQLRKASEPYTTYALKDARLSEEWQEYTVTGGVTDDTPGFLLLLANRPMTFWIDDAELADLTK